MTQQQRQSSSSSLSEKMLVTSAVYQSVMKNDTLKDVFGDDILVGTNELRAKQKQQQQTSAVRESRKRKRSTLETEMYGQQTITGIHWLTQQQDKTTVSNDVFDCIHEQTEL
jgi:hypothetical protein